MSTPASELADMSRRAVRVFRNLAERVHEEERERTCKLRPHYQRVHARMVLAGWRFTFHYGGFYSAIWDAYDGTGKWRSQGKTLALAVHNAWIGFEEGK
jgi:hypothetical protein